MSRLIDADDFIKLLRANTMSNGTLINTNTMLALVEKMPTAYNIENVMEQLEVAKGKIAKRGYCMTKHYVDNDCEHKDCFVCCAEYLIGIVKRGGVDG